MKIKKICVISQGYPTKGQPWFSFVDQLLCAFSDLGVECTVICPQSYSKSIIRKIDRRDIFWKKKYNNSIIRVYQPHYLSISNAHVSTNYFSDINFEKAVISKFQSLNEKFDLIYGHFWQCGLIAAKISHLYHLPAFVACGESKIPYQKLKRNLQYLNYIRGVICVSSQTKKKSIEYGLCTNENSKVFPNAIDEELFYQRDRTLIRKELNIPNHIFIVSFVGDFTDRKGSMRLSMAIDQMEDVYSIFIGSGSEYPICKNRIYTGALPHEEVANYLCASNVFVLPTTNEGCCNAIVEAMACGLPIISSKGEFNDDILNVKNSIRIDPLNINEIINAISTIKNNNEMQESMAKESLLISKRLRISQRAKNICNFMEEKIGLNENIQ